MLSEQPTLLSFQQKSLQEFSASVHIARKLQKMMAEGQDLQVNKTVTYCRSRMYPSKSIICLAEDKSSGTGSTCLRVMTSEKRKKT